MGGGGGEDQTNLEFTPTWVVAVVCSVIVAVSFAVERSLHYAGKYLKKKNQKPLFQALQKIKEELMLMGFISLLLTVTQNGITKICVHPSWSRYMLPCGQDEKEHEESLHATIHFQTSLSSSATFGLRHLLSEEKTSSESATGYCTRKGKVPLISSEALHHLHIFIFVLAVVHVTVCVLTIVFGGARMRQWKHWENSIAKETDETNPDNGPAVTHVQQHDFIRGRFLGFGKNSVLLSWLHSFLKQFYASVTKSDYETLRFGFIMTHWNQNRKFDFHRYMMRALEDDFKKVVGISWYLWIFVVIFLLLNVNGWHAYFWIAFIPFILLLAMGTKLEHVITQLAHEVAAKHAAVEGAIVVQPSDDHFWFHKPKFVLFLIHLILFQNAFEIAFFFWIWVTYGFDSCIMGQVGYIVPRLVIGVFIQVLCSYSTLPLYAIVTQMGTHYKAAIFNEHVQEGLAGWTQRVKKKKAQKRESPNDGPSSSGGVQLCSLSRKQTAPQHNPPNPESPRAPLKYSQAHNGFV